MTVQITIEVPDTLGQQLRALEERLPEVLERGLRDLAAEQSSSFLDEQEMIELLTSQPTPEQVLAVKASPRLQQRLSALLAGAKEESLSREEERELDRILLIEHVMRMAKAHAVRRISTGQ